MVGRTDALTVGVDARSIFMPRPRGTGRNLLDAYRLIPRLRPDWQFALYHQRDPAVCADYADGDGVLESVVGQPNVEQRRIEMPGDRFDAVTLFDCLEHLDDPNETVDRIAGMLARDGRIVVTVPNAERAMLFDRDNFDQPPHHLTRWTAPVLENFLAR
ncbi:MAG: class I SAM-dependent methyltransferase, partial [Planctomycetes bacterium]|nr:class I SAM-dependent methyltransferase [Planctomycetota bacterium]